MRRRVRSKSINFSYGIIKMGNLPSKRQNGQQQQKHVKTSLPDNPTNAIPESLKTKINPLNIFGIDSLSKTEVIQFLDSPQFIRKYHQLMRQHHPDRGGTALHCSIINYSYEKLKQAKETFIMFSNQREKTGQELRDEAKQSSVMNKQNEKVMAQKMQEMMRANPGDFQKKFNEAFVLTKINDYTDDGVQVDDDERTKSTKRQVISVRRDPTVTASNMNQRFEQTATVNTALIVKENKQPQGVSSLKHAVYEYGKKEEDDFGRYTTGGADYRIAYAGERLIDPSTATPKDKQLTGKVTMSMAKKARESQNLKPEMTQAEREIWAMEQEASERHEEERMANIVERDYESQKRQNIFIERMLTFSG